MPRSLTSYLPVLLLLLPLSLPKEAQASPERPDILLVIADDMDYRHLGFRLPHAHTPHLDQLRKRGTLFEVAWIAPVCAPSLATLLTGKTSIEHGRYYNKNRSKIDRDLDTSRSIANELGKAGYRSFVAGKWWYGPIEKAGFEAGFTDFDQFARKTQKPIYDWLDGLEKEENFFLWWAPLLPHGPHNPPKKYLDLISREEIQVPPHVPSKVTYTNHERVLLAMTAWFDDAFGDLSRELQTRGRDKNILIVFVIDNGYAMGYVSKNSPYEFGWQSPILFAGPGIPEGESRTQLASGTDIYPTLLDFAGIPRKKTTGMTLRPFIEDGSKPGRSHLIQPVWPSHSFVDSWREELMAVGVRDEKYKMIRWFKDVREKDKSSLRIAHRQIKFPERNDGDSELYDLLSDPHELQNLIGNSDLAEVEASLKKKIDNFLKSKTSAR